jgi:hypothetical protein
MIEQEIVPKNEVVQTARNYARRQDDWSDELEVIFISLMNYLAGTGYQVGPVQNNMLSWKRVLLWFGAIDIVPVPGNLSYEKALLLMTTSYIQSWLS